MKLTSYLLMTVLLLTIVTAANYQDDPLLCPVEYNFVTCTGGELQCGINPSGDPYCYDMTSLSPPSVNATTYSTNYGGNCTGGYCLDCQGTDAGEPYCDNSGNFLCDRNESHHGAPDYRNTDCLKDVWGQGVRGSCLSGRGDCTGDDNCECDFDDSTCDVCGFANGVNNTASDCSTCACDSGFGYCASPGNPDDSAPGTNGCPVQFNSFSNYDCNDLNSSSGTNNMVNTSCDCVCRASFIACASNATSRSQYEGCNVNDDVTDCSVFGWNGTGNNVDSSCTCVCDAGRLNCDGNMTGTGCEVTDGGACTTAGLPGTYNGCTCEIDAQDIAQTGMLVNWSGTNPMLWLQQLGSGYGIWQNFSNGMIFAVNESGAFFNGTNLSLSGGAVGGGDDNDGNWTVDKPDYYNFTRTDNNVSVDVLNVSGNLGLGGILYREGQDDTFISMLNTDLMSFELNNITWLIFNTFGEDTIYVGDGSDIDIIFNNDMNIIGSTGQLVVPNIAGCNADNEKLETNSSGTLYCGVNPTNGSGSGSSTSFSPQRQLFTGLNATGSSGNINRVIVLNNTVITQDERINVDNYYLLNTIDYTVNHKSSSSNITFLNPLWDDQNVMIDFFINGSTSLSIIDEAYTGENATGSSGTINRVLVLSNTDLTQKEIINVDNFYLIETIDYTINHKSTASNITFINPIWNDQNINVRYFK